MFVCGGPEKVRAAKKEIRDIYGIGNHSVHINDSHDEAVRLAQTFFNDNSLYVFNNRPFYHQNEHFDGLIDELKRTIHERGIDPDDVCAAGSTPFSVLDIRVSKDLDFLYCGDALFEPDNRLISNHDSQLRYYPRNKFEIIKNPKYHFYHNGLKFITLDVLHAMKTRRNEQPKDVNDCKLIKNFQKTKRRFRFVLYRKDRIGDLRKITVCNLTFSYRRTKKKKARE